MLSKWLRERQRGYRQTLLPGQAALGRHCRVFFYNVYVPEMPVIQFTRGVFTTRLSAAWARGCALYTEGTV